jgi:hypothetical protein
LGVAQVSAVTKRARDAFIELRDLWRGAFARLPDADDAGDFQQVAAEWRRGVWDREERADAALQETLSARFSARLPEPFFGQWLTNNGELNARGKTIVGMINPGDGIPYDAYFYSEMSIVGRPFFAMLREFYANGGFLEHAGEPHHLLYKRTLRDESFVPPPGDTKDYAWVWWGSRFANILRALGYDEAHSEESELLTFEFFAYQSRTASLLDESLARRLPSTMLVGRLVAELLQLREGRPRAVVLVNKARQWGRLLSEVLERRVDLRPACPHPEHARLQRLEVGGEEGHVPMYVVTSQGMYFPRRDAGASCLFP